MRQTRLKMWLGFDLAGWLRLLWANRLQVDVPFWPYAALITLAATYHSLAKGLQHMIFNRKIQRVRWTQKPVIIIGHWRSGTTYLHDLLSQDPQFIYPTSFQCFNANHFLLTGRFERIFLRTQTQRAMDDMPLSVDGPQEDEFALCSLGLPSPYLKMAFPNRPCPHPEALDLQAMKPRQLRRWKRSFVHFLKMVALSKPGGVLLLKSPPHTCRIRTILELLPGARFIHLVRSPHAVIPSTIHLWKVLYADQGLQIPTFENLEDEVFEMYDHVFRRLEGARDALALTRFCEARYEDVTAEPIQQLRMIYQRLDLGDFETVRPRIVDYLASTVGYQARDWPLSLEMKDRITRQCAYVMTRYGYSRNGP